MKPKHLIFVLIISLLVGCSYKSVKAETPPQELNLAEYATFLTEKDEKVRQQKAEALFCIIYDLQFLSDEEQAKHLPTIYREVVTRIGIWARCNLPVTEVYASQIPKETRGKEALEILRKKIGRNPPLSYDLLADWISNICLDLLGKFPELTLSEIKKDLANYKDNPRQATLALSLGGRIRIASLYDTVAEIFRESEELRSTAVYALQRFGNIKAIDVILEGNEEALKEYSTSLLCIQKEKPAHKKLLGYLSHPNPQIRWRAAYILSRSGDPVLVPHAKKLMKDEHPDVRREGFMIAFHLPDKEKTECRAEMVSLLKDTDKLVKVSAATYFARAKDTVCGQTLLELLRDESLDQSTYYGLIHAVNGLTGTYFGHHGNSDSWKPGTGSNEKFITTFEQWLKEHTEE